MPQISVLICTLNGGETIRRAIESVQAQTFQDIEIVVVDDGSTDNTQDVVREMSTKDARIKFVRLPKNMGVGAARNIALETAAGEWITILDGDDWYEPIRLEALLTMAQAKNADFIADNLKIYDHIRKKIVDRTRYDRDDHLMELSAKVFFENDNPLRRYPMGFLQPMINRQFIRDQKISYDPEYRVGEDFIFMAELLLHGAKAYIVPEAYYVYIHRISPTTRKISPYSRSEVANVFALFVRGCDKLLQKYDSLMTRGDRHALLERRQILKSAIKYQNMRAALSQGKYREGASIVLTNPLICLLIIHIIANWLIANARLCLSALARLWRAVRMRSAY